MWRCFPSFVKTFASRKNNGKQKLAYEHCIGTALPKKSPSVHGFSKTSIRHDLEFLAQGKELIQGHVLPAILQGRTSTCVGVRIVGHGTPLSCPCTHGHLRLVLNILQQQKWVKRDLVELSCIGFTTSPTNQPANQSANQPANQPVLATSRLASRTHGTVEIAQVLGPGHQ